MSTENLSTVASLVDRAGAVDTTETFQQLWGLVGELRARIDERFTLERDPSSLPFDTYASDGPGPRGHMTTWSGPGVDWMVQSHIGNPAVSFSNMHLTLWQPASNKVPSLAFAFGTMPDLFFLIELPARTDLRFDIDSLARYYAPLNERWMEFRKHPDLRIFTSPSIYVRQVLSEVSMCGLLPRTDESFAYVRQLAHDTLTTWLEWMENPELTPEDEQAALAAADLQVRRYSAELDPANNMAVRFFGAEKMEQLVRQLWGGDRHSVRPGGHSNDTSKRAHVVIH